MANYKQDFKEIQPLGSGGFSTVFESIWIADGKHYAIKKIPFRSEQTNKTLEEINFLNALKSDFVVQYVNSWIEENYYIGTKCDDLDQRSLLFDPNLPLLLHIQMELCSMTLKIFISESLKYTETNSITYEQYRVCCNIFEQLLNCIHYLHEHNPNIIHRDLKPENIMISVVNNEMLLKLADFGLSTFHSFVDKSHTKYMGTVQYRAPELVDKHYDTRADLYSLGIIMKELFNFNINESNRDIDSKISTQYNYLMGIYEKCTAVRMIDRPTCVHILENKTLWCYSVEVEESPNSFYSAIDEMDNELFDTQSIKDVVMDYGFDEQTGKDTFNSLREETVDILDNKLTQQTELVVEDSRVAKKEQLYYDIPFQNERFKKEYICNVNNDKIGCDGEISSVYKAKHKLDKSSYAIKIREFKLSDESENELKQVKQMLRELEVIASLKYDYLLQYKSYWFECDLNVAQLYIQMELCAIDLKSVLKITEKITPNLMHLFVMSNIFKEIVMGVQYLHSHDPKIIHRDLKPANILLTKGVKGKFIKISDFGFAKFYNNSKNSSNLSTSADFTAPEVRTGDYDITADIFSLGMVLAKIINFLTKVNKADCNRNIQAIYFGKLNKLLHLKSRMIDHTAKNRPTCEQILADKSWLLTEVEAKSIDKFKTFNENYVFGINESFFEYYTNEKLKYCKIINPGFFRKIQSALGFQ